MKRVVLSKELIHLLEPESGKIDHPFGISIDRQSLKCFKYKKNHLSRVTSALRKNNEMLTQH
jgi:hypothetical protein